MGPYPPGALSSSHIPEDQANPGRGAIREPGRNGGAGGRVDDPGGTDKTVLGDYTLIS